MTIVIKGDVMDQKRLNPMTRYTLLTNAATAIVFHPDDIQIMREYFPDLHQIADLTLQSLWEEFSEQEYSAGWIGVDEASLATFKKWLELPCSECVFDGYWTFTKDIANHYAKLYDGRNFEGHNFSDSNLGYTSFQGCNLRGANFSHARFENTDFTGADVTGANFEGATGDTIGLTLLKGPSDSEV